MITIHPHFSILYHSNDQRKNIEQLIQKIKKSKTRIPSSPLKHLDQQGIQNQLSLKKRL